MAPQQGLAGAGWRPSLRCCLIRRTGQHPGGGPFAATAAVPAHGLERSADGLRPKPTTALDDVVAQLFGESRPWATALERGDWGRQAGALGPRGTRNLNLKPGLDSSPGP